MPHVLVAGHIHDAGLALLRGSAEVTLEIAEGTTTDSYAPLIGRADALLIRTQPLPAAVIECAGRLKIVSRHGVGYDAVDVAALSARKIPLTIVGDVNSLSVAEHTMMLILTLAKRTFAYDACARSGDWAYRNGFAAVDLAGKVLLVIGFGRIGRHVAKLAGAFGMRVQAHDPFIDAQAIRSAGAMPAEDLGPALEAADVVSIHVPLTKGGVLIGGAELARMKPSAFVVNTARGGLIDETALMEALRQGRLAGAGLDVFIEEPARRDHPLLSSDRVVLSPHSAGLTRECAERMSLSAAQNVLDFFAGRLNPALVVNAAEIGMTGETPAMQRQ